MLDSRLFRSHRAFVPLRMDGVNLIPFANAVCIADAARGQRARPARVPYSCVRLINSESCLSCYAIINMLAARKVPRLKSMISRVLQNSSTFKNANSQKATTIQWTALLHMSWCSITDVTRSNNSD